MNGSASEAHRRHGHKHSTNNRNDHIRECSEWFRLPQQFCALNCECRECRECTEDAGTEKRMREQSRWLSVKKQHQHHADQRASNKIDRKRRGWECS